MNLLQIENKGPTGCDGEVDYSGIPVGAEPLSEHVFPKGVEDISLYLSIGPVERL